GPAPSFPSPPEPVLKWISLLGALALVGGSSFYLLVAAPALRRFEEVAQGVAQRVRILQGAAVLVVVVSEAARLLVQASTLYEIPASQAFGLPALKVLTETEWGALVAGRVALMALIAAIMAVSAFSSRRSAASDTGWWPTLGIGALALATFSLSSHGFALDGLQVEGTVTDYLHLMAAAIWVGGLLHLLLGFPFLASLHPLDRQEALPALITRFSRVAGPSVGVLIVTGLYSAWAMAGSVLPAYTQTPYGQALLAKIALVALVLLLAAANLLLISPHLGYGSAWRWLRRLLLGEVLLAGLALLAAGYLTTMEPARPVAAREGLGQAQALFLHAEAGDKHLSIRIEPGQVGDNSLFILVDDREYNPVNDADVTLQLADAAADLQIEDLSTLRSGEGEYSVEAVPLDVAGQWRLDLTVRRPGSFDARTSLEFEVASAVPPDPSYIPTNTGRVWFGVELLTLGLLFQGTGFRLGAGRSRVGFMVLLVASAMAISGLFYLATGLFTGAGGTTGP
ncbi:MAG: CopD family protein, partial [Dehalococcoidia bacterium]|nr:CopD family protein [Dehalococcoidia bacterium]